MSRKQSKCRRFQTFGFVFIVLFAVANIMFLGFIVKEWELVDDLAIAHSEMDPTLDFLLSSNNNNKNNEMPGNGIRKISDIHELELRNKQCLFLACLEAS